ncbi:hypothetical protein H311_00785 [Anncaliia algerae PRA109]|nr:hypothetical protein H311_00785 [Anncaliia algerae PRA109]
MLADSLGFSDVKIGYPNIIVEIDKTKLVKRNFNSGRLFIGAWIIEEIKRNTDKKILLVEVPDRTAEAIKNISYLIIY